MIVFLIYLQVLLLALQFYCFKTQDGSCNDFKSSYATLGSIPVILLMMVISYIN